MGYTPMRNGDCIRGVLSGVYSSEWGYEPNGVGATLCRPERRNGVISVAMGYTPMRNDDCIRGVLSGRVFAPNGIMNRTV